MSVTLFYCPECDRYTTLGAIVKLEVRADLNVSRRRLFECVRISSPVDGFSLNDIVRSECSRCGGPTKLTTLDKCLHRWRGHCSDGTIRVCALCEEEQQGRVVFDDGEEGGCL